MLVSVLQALVSIIVRNEFCQSFAEADGLELLREIMLDHPDDDVGGLKISFCNFLI